MVTRREALRQMGIVAAGAAGAGALGCSNAESGTPDLREVPAQRLGTLGVQLYTVRSEMTQSVEATLARVAEIGYGEVEFAGYFGHSPTEIRAMLDANGLVAPAAHIGANVLGDQWAGVLESANTIGHTHMVVPSLPMDMRSSLDAWRRTAELFNVAAEQARAAGIQFAYHNHAFEFEEMDGRVQFDVFCEETDPDLVQIELDLFWITHGGSDPIAFFDRWPGRVPLVHVKGRSADGEMVDVGAGAMDWAGIFAHRDHAGIRHYFVEHDQPGEDPFASIQASYTYLRALEL
jgi:sugar phosphate isomerase/epimerase